MTLFIISAVSLYSMLGCSSLFQSVLHSLVGSQLFRFWMNICLLFYEWWENKSYAVTELFGCTFQVITRLNSKKNKRIALLTMVPLSTGLTNKTELQVCSRILVRGRSMQNIACENLSGTKPLKSCLLWTSSFQIQNEGLCWIDLHFLYNSVSLYVVSKNCLCCYGKYTDKWSYLLSLHLFDEVLFL